MDMILISNKNAKREFEILKHFQAGIILNGPEVKSLRQKTGSFAGSHIRILNQEAFLLNCQINPYAFADNKNYDPKRTRKLLLTKKEITNLLISSDKKNTAIIPLSFETVGKNIKLNLALARGKKEFEKREDLKKKAIKRDLDREIKDKIRLK